MNNNDGVEKILYLVGISHQETDAETLGRCGVPQDSATIAESAILKGDDISEALVLSTCNRVEIYVVASSEDALKQVIKIFATSPNRNFANTEFEKFSYVKKNGEAIEHIFEVASGLQSQMTGETEILGQVKTAYARAVGAGHCGVVLNTVFQKANQCAKWVRSNTDIGHGKISLGSVASELANRIFDDLTKAKILLLGSGEAGKLVAEALYVRGARDISVASRQFENARKLAEQIGGNTLEISDAISDFSKFDIAICASFSPEPLVKTERVKLAIQERSQKPIFLIDLAVPYNIETACADIEDVYLYDLRDLSKIANENISMRKSEIEIARKTIRQKTEYVSKKLGF